MRTTLPILFIALGLLACDPGGSPDADGGDDASLPADPSAAGFVVQLSDAVNDGVDQDGGVAEVTTDAGSLNLVFRRERNLVVGLNFLGATSFPEGTFDAASAVAGTGDTGASLSVVDGSGERLTGVDPAGTIVIDDAGETLSGSFALTFNVLGEEGTISVDGTFQNIPSS